MTFWMREQPTTPRALRGSDFNRWLLAMYGPAVGRSAAETMLPIPWPEFKDLPPTLQMRLAAAQMAEERRRLAMVGQ